MEKFIIEKKELEAVFDLIKKDYEVHGPKLKRGEGSLSNTDVVDYSLIENLDELAWGKKSFFSPKEFLLPVSESLMTFENNVAAGEPLNMKEGNPSGEPTRRVGRMGLALFLRPCDSHALKRTDSHFLKGVKDENYEKRRANTLIFVMECSSLMEGCFCLTMGTKDADFYDLLIRKENGHYRITIGNASLVRYFSSAVKSDSIDEASAAGKENWMPPLPEITPDVHSFQAWREYGKRCVGCGACNFVCPTCFCFTVRDELKEDGAIKRERVWSSCQVKGFAKVFGGYEYRSEQSDKGRFKFLHKFRDFKVRHGMNLCVGCGRCVEVCPEFIDIRVLMAKTDVESKISRMRDNDESIYTKGG